MKPTHFALSIGVIVLSGTAILSQGTQGSEPKITFKHPSDAPPSRSGGLSFQAEYPPAAIGGGSKEPGSFAGVVAHRISAVTDTGVDPSRFKAEAPVEELFRQIMNSANTNTFDRQA